MRDMYVPTYVYLSMTLTWGFSCCLIFLRGVALFEAIVAFVPSLAKDVVLHLVSWEDGGLPKKRASKIDDADFGAHDPINLQVIERFSLMNVLNVLTWLDLLDNKQPIHTRCKEISFEYNVIIPGNYERCVNTIFS